MVDKEDFEPILTLEDRGKKLFYRFLVKGGRLLRKAMWRLIGLRKPERRLHPKHLALPELHHHWFLPELKPGYGVLDLGCGRGAHCAAVTRAGGRAVGVERNARELAGAVRQPGVSYIRADLESVLPFADRSFDAVLALDVIEHLEKRGQFLFEIRRVTAHDGLLFLSAPNRRTRWKSEARRLSIFEMSDPDHKIEYEKTQLLDALRESGFEVLRVDPVVYDTPWDAWIDFLGALSPRLYRRVWEWKRRRAIREPDQSTGFRVTAAVSIRGRDAG